MQYIKFTIGGGVTLTQAVLKQKESSFGAEKITFVEGKTKFYSKRDLLRTEKIKFCSRKKLLL